MNRLRGHWRFLAWLSATTLVLIVGLVLLLNVLLRQVRAVEDAARLQTDSITALAFHFEREFLRFRSELRMAAQNPAYDGWDDLALRHDIFLSRAQLLRDNPSMAKLHGRAEYEKLLPRIESLVARSEPLVNLPRPDVRELQGLHDEMVALGPDVLALSTAANSVITQMLDSQLQTVRTQSQLNATLIAAMIVVTLLAAIALWLRHQRQTVEQLALNRLNRNLRDAQLKAELASESKSRFLANMSHELRTPFNGLLGMLDLLEASPLSTQQREQVGSARESAQYLLTLLNDILDLSAIEAGKVALQPEPVNLPRLLQEVQTLMRSLAQGKGLSLQSAFGAGLPEWIGADPTRLRQILYNLLGNAIKFTRQGHVLLAVTAEPVRSTEGEPARQRVAFSISDTGIGISPEEQARLFERFYQVDSGATRAFGGRGLGLDISRTLARLMGGDIAVSSTLGGGSTFTLSLDLPLCEAPEPAAPAAGLAADGNRPLRVLVAEDHPVNRKLVGALLEKMGHQVLFAENGREALALATSEAPDLVLMDVQMPEMDGLTSTRRIRALTGPAARVPVIALTADVMNEARDKALDAGADDFLAKPVQPERLRQAIARWGYQPSAMRSGR